MLLLLVTSFYSSCQTMLKSWPLCKDIFPLLPLTISLRITTVCRRPPCTRASTHTHLLSHTEILGAKQEYPIFQVTKLRLILPKFPQRRQGQNPTQVRINQECPPLRSLGWSVLGPPGASSLRGGLPNGPTSSVSRGPENAVCLSQTKARSLGRPWLSQVGSAACTHGNHLRGSQ